MSIHRYRFQYEHAIRRTVYFGVNRFPPSLGSVITRNSRVSGDPSDIDVAIMEHHYAGKRCILIRRRLAVQWCQIIPRNGRGHETLASTQLES